MRVDPDRQWFVYFKETEMGPFAEPEMLKKIHARDFDDTAFVYTDGMSDWELIKDSELQVLLVPQTTKEEVHEEKVPVEIFTEKVSVGPSLVDATSRFDTKSQTKAPAPEPEIVSSEPPKMAAKARVRSSMGFKPLVAILFLVIVGAGYFLNRDLIDSYISGANQEKLIDLSETVVTTSTNPVAELDTSVNWSELDTFVRIQDPQGPAFRIADKTLAGLRPILVGALSPMLKMSRVTIAVFPDNDRSLYVAPPLWVWNEGVHSGYFSAGPHLNNGQDLLPGRYRVLIASQGKFLGDVGFELGVYPIGDALAEKKAEMQKQLGEVSAKERSSLKTKISSVDALGKKSFSLEPLAIDRKGKRRAWLEQRAPITKELSELREAQAKFVTGPMFYAGEQTLLLTVIRALDSYVEGLEFYSYGGPEHVSLKLNTTVESLRAAVSTAWQKLEISTKDLDAKDSFEPLRLDAEVIKARVLEESK